jgi:rhodanese-related sulfurtransferase
VRSERVTAYLNGNGLDAANVAGGMLAWVAAGRPLVCETPHPEPGIL